MEPPNGLSLDHRLHNGRLKHHAGSLCASSAALAEQFLLQRHAHVLSRTLTGDIAPPSQQGFDLVTCAVDSHSTMHRQNLSINRLT